MTDTKGGFLAAEDDPHNKAMMHASSGGRGGSASSLLSATATTRPPHMTQQQWERQRLMNSLREAKAGPFEPAINPGVKRGAGGESVRGATSAAGAGGGGGGGGGGTEQVKMCCECESLEIDWKWDEVFGCQVCNKCKERLPDKYSLLTKTEVKEDYLLTDRELPFFPHLSWFIIPFFFLVALVSPSLLLSCTKYLPSPFSNSFSFPFLLILEPALCTPPFDSITFFSPSSFDCHHMTRGKRNEKKIKETKRFFHIYI